MNPIIELLDRRVSVRSYTDLPITESEREAILNGAFRAPTAGNLMLYSIIDVRDQAIKDRLADLCDDQPFIGKAPLVLIFMADYQKWIDLFRAVDVESINDANISHRMAPGAGDLTLAIADAVIAAQNAVVVAESLGIGSCYIGDINEHGEEVSSLLNLPPHTFPAAMLCFGHPAHRREPVGRYTNHVVHVDRYQRLDATELVSSAEELGALHAPQGLRPGVATYPEDVYRRKWTSDYAREMNRSTEWWMERWTNGGANER